MKQKIANILRTLADKLYPLRDVVLGEYEVPMSFTDKPKKELKGHCNCKSYMALGYHAATCPMYDSFM